MANNRFLVVAAHRRLGKTLFSVISLVLSALSDRSGDGRYAYIAPLYRQAKQTSWDYFKRFLYAVPAVKFYESDLRIELPNGARISLYGADNPDALRGIYLDGVVLDEVAQMRPQVWGEVVRPTLSDRGGWGLFIGTPKGVDAFYELFNEAKETPQWDSVKFRADETGIISEEELLAMRREMTARQYAQEMLCEFAAGTDEVLIPIDLADMASKRKIDQRDLKRAVKVLGVDVARYGDDRSVIMPVAGLQAYEPHIYQGLDNVALAQKVMALMESFEPDYVRVDAGRGEGVIDYMRANGFKVTEVNFGGAPKSDYFANARAEMWAGTKQWVMDGGCIPPMSELISELATPRFSFTPNNKMVIESKEKMRSRGLRSTDIADSLVLAVGYRLKKPYYNAGGRSIFANAGYDEFACEQMVIDL